jgi:hypothetical protein
MLRDPDKFAKTSLTARFAAKCLGLAKRLWAALLAAAAAAKRGRSVIDEPGIFDVNSETSIKVTTPTGAAPVRPRTDKKSADISSPRAQRLARRAAIFLFDHYEFASVPGQFWPFLDMSFDPGQAMEEFLGAIGCKTELVQRHDPLELRRAAEVIEFLLRSGDILHRLPPEMRRALSLELGSGNYDDVRSIAETAAHLQAALNFASAWSGKPIIPSFAGLLRTIEHMLNNAVAVSADEASQASNLVAKFSDLQRQFGSLNAQYASVVAALRDIWPDAWRGTEREEELRRITTDFEQVAGSMDSSPDLSLDDVTDGIDFLAMRLRELEGLLRANPSGKDRKGEGAGAGGTRKPESPDEKEIALRYFGFSSECPPGSKQALNRAYRAKTKEVHPDAHPGASDAQRKEFEIQFTKCNQHYTILIAHFSWR